jgi:hypothetical protein
MARISTHTAQIISMHDEYRAAARTAEKPADAERFMGLALKNGSHAAQRIGLNTEQHTSEQIAWAYDFLNNVGDLDHTLLAALGNCEGFLRRQHA